MTTIGVNKNLDTLIIDSTMNHTAHKMKSVGNNPNAFHKQAGHDHGFQSTFAARTGTTCVTVLSLATLFVSGNVLLSLLITFNFLLSAKKKRRKKNYFQFSTCTRYSTRVGKSLLLFQVTLH